MLSEKIHSLIKFTSQCQQETTKKQAQDINSTYCMKTTDEMGEEEEEEEKFWGRQKQFWKGRKKTILS